MSLNPKVWGPKTWFFLDSIIIGMNDDNLAVYKEFFQKLGHVLPCAGCRTHYNQYLDQYPMTDITNKDEMFIWLNTLHNKVRERSGKKARDIKAVIKYYNNEYNTSNMISYCMISLCVLIFVIVFLVRWRK
jgi:uncharacterized membrane-anchored protein